MLEIQNVSKTFNAGTVNEKTALNGLNLKLNEGDFVTVIGGNGAGKSTMLNAVAGVWPVDSGKIIIDGIDVTKLGEHQRAAYIGRVFQDPMTGTAATMQIEENLALAAARCGLREKTAAIFTFFTFLPSAQNISAIQPLPITPSLIVFFIILIRFFIIF